LIRAYSGLFAWFASDLYLSESFKAANAPLPGQRLVSASLLSGVSLVLSIL
jgi:hypothetical protein